MTTNVWQRAWSLISRHERRNLLILMLVVVIAALTSAAMVGSILPFLSILAEPSKIHTSAILNKMYAVLKFDNDYNFIIFIGLLSFLVIIFANIFQIMRIYVVTRFSNRQVHELSFRLLKSYISQPYEHFASQNSGEIGTQILSESQMVVQQFFRPAIETISSLLTITSIITLLLFVNPTVAMIAFSTVGGIYGGAYILSRSFIKKLGAKRASSNKMRYRIANEAIDGIKDIKLLCLENTYLERYRKPSLIMTKANSGAAVAGQTPQYIMQAIAFGGMIAICIALLDAKNIENGNALGGILPLIGLFAFAGQRLIPELSRFYQNASQLNYGNAAVNTVYGALIKETKKIACTGEEIVPIGLKNKLELHNLSFRYEGAESDSLRNINLTIKSGEKVGIVGSTGAGKTTLADILLGLLHPSAGEFIIDQKAISENNIRNWRRSVGYVPQDIFLIDASIEENIALGIAPEDISREQVRKAAKIAQIDDFIINEMPFGYSSPVGERGTRLSGGQRQRIGIARSLYHDADVLIFDEATSALDNATEQDLLNAIDALPGDKTVIMIAHRLSTVQKCDKIVVLDKGKVSGCGSWKHLKKNNEIFKRISNPS